MAVTVTPETFAFVNFSAARIAELAAEVLAALGLSDDLHVEVDERTPAARLTVTDGSPIVVHADSGAFEDTRQPRAMSDVATTLALGRVLLRLRDRREGGFAEAPPDTELSLVELAAWDSYVLGRLARLGVPVHEPRWRYNFRNRHGFSDAADAAFDRLFSSDGLTWGAVSAISESARAASATV